MGGGGGPWNRFGTDEQLSRRDAERVLRRLWKLLRPWRRRIFLGFLLISGQTACLLAGPALVGRARGARAGAAVDHRRDQGR
jgi:hypothetical protein